MRLVIVGPGIMPIPPTGWGAVESLIWDYKLFINRYHPNIDVHIVNTPHPQNIINEVNSINPDVVHIQYDNHITITPYLQCKYVLATSHYGYLDQKYTRPYDNYFHTIFNQFVHSSAILSCLSPSIAKLYLDAGVPQDRVIVQHNGANDEVFRYSSTPLFPDRSIYLAKIDYRKRQHIYQNIPNLYFAGNNTDSRFNTVSPCYLGEWSKNHLYNNLTDYANLVLLSDGEAHPLVCCEALIAGLGLVISEYATANLDTTLPFIDVIPTERLDDIDYVTTVIETNRQKSLQMRNQIREYGLKTFGWKNVVDRYVSYLKDMCTEPEIGAYFQCYKNPYATYKTLESFRKHYPSSSVVLLSDNGYDYTKMAEHFNCTYIHSSDKQSPTTFPYPSKSWVLSLFKKMYHACTLIKEPYIILLEDDVIINNKIKVTTFPHAINGYCPNRYDRDTLICLASTYPHINIDACYRWSGHGGSIYNKAVLLNILTCEEEIDDLVTNWRAYKCVSNLPLDYFLSLLVHITRSGTVGPYTGHGDGPRDIIDSGLTIQHQYKKYYNMQLPSDLAHLCSAQQRVAPLPGTTVTALYDIGRSKIDGRSMQEYINWLKKTLQQITSPIVLYLDSSLNIKKELLALREPIGPIDIIEGPLTDIPMWKYKEKVTDILENPTFKQVHPNDITNRLPEYCLIQYSKFGFLEDAIRRNPFKSSTFAWVDAGISRFMNPDDSYNLQKESDSTFYVQTDAAKSMLSQITADNYIGTNTCILKGGIWVMDSYIFDIVYNAVMYIFEEEMIAKHRIDNEQIALALAKRNSYADVFSLVDGTGQVDTLLKYFYKP